MNYGKPEKETFCSLTGSGNEFHPSKQERGKLLTDFKEQIKQCCGVISDVYTILIFKSLATPLSLLTTKLLDKSCFYKVLICSIFSIEKCHCIL